VDIPSEYKPPHAAAVLIQRRASEATARIIFGNAGDYPRITELNFGAPQGGAAFRRPDIGTMKHGASRAGQPWRAARSAGKAS
jgi:hypothetical protein